MPDRHYGSNAVSQEILLTIRDYVSCGSIGMRFKRRTIPLEFRLFRHLAGFACLLFLIGCSAEALGEWNLPQSTDKVLLPAPVQKVLQATLSAPVGTAPVLLSSESTAPIITSLPKGFRDSCNKIVENWATAVGTDQWTARVLFSTHIEGGIEAVLALRCGSSRADMKEWYDERPAVVVLTRESASLRLVPLEKECNDCERFYHVEFSKTHTAVGARLVELRVYYSDDNPCCDGTDHKDGNRLVIVSLPIGEQVLSTVVYTDENSVDDEAGTDTVWLCEAKIAYENDLSDHLRMIRTETYCTVDKVPQPEVKRQSFRWNAVARTFEEVKPALP
jgi:hypothetical protein